MGSTIKDVAKKAGVSTATVSLVLHNSKRISAATRKKVLKIVETLNYSPSKIARGLVLQQTHNIGFIVTDDHFLRTEPFYTHIFLGTEFESRGYEYYILLHTIPSKFDGVDCLPRFVKEHNVDGIIVAGKVPNEIISCVEPYNIPLVFVDFYPSTGDYSAVLIDNIGGGKKATQHLIVMGHTNIGFLGGDMTHPSIRDRYKGYRQALKNHNLKYYSNYVIRNAVNTDRESGYWAANKLMLNRGDITAVFACNDAMAIGALQYFKEQGIKVPDDISLIGFDDVEAGAFCSPPLSTMRVLKTDLGTLTMKLMVDILKARKEKLTKILVGVDLIERESVKNLISLN
jgi:LacI family transcriptional regulator